MPALTSSMWAPASTWASTSRSTRLKSPFLISSARSLRPVGLIRSPMMTNGRSKPMTTSRVADETTVRVTPGVPDATPPAATSAGQLVLAVGRLEPARLGVRLRLEVVAARSLGLAPLGDVVVHRPLAGLHGGLVDGHLEARVQDDLARPSAVLGDDLGRDVAPPDDGQRAGHQAAPRTGRSRRRGPERSPPAVAAARLPDGPELAEPGRRGARSRARAGRPRGCARSVSSGSSVWAR